jgi:L-ascorbate metabolism protein UlaG (beta-lactamase superfamily)
MIAAHLKDEALLADILSASGDALHLWWLGQSGFLIKLRGAYLLADPYLSDSLTLKYAATDKPHVRMTERCIAPAALRFVDLILSSHQHTDHFDEATLLPIAHPGQRLILPAQNVPAAQRRLGGAAITLLPINDGITLDIDGWRITGIAAAHDEIVRDAQGQCACLGFLIQRDEFTLYHSGDTRLHPGLEPSLRPARCDVMLLPINGSKPERRVAGNMSGPEAASLAAACEARIAVPHHYDMFEFNTESPSDFISACTTQAQAHRVLRCGERLTLPPR